MGKKVEWIDIDFKGLIPALQAGRADIAVSAIYITPERSLWSTSPTRTTPAAWSC